MFQVTLVGNVTCVDLGTRDYLEVWNLQRKLVKKRLGNEVKDVLLLVEHPHVFTVGKRGPKQFKVNNIPVYFIERGGQVTYHGYGQLVAYPILSLQDSRLDVRTYVRALEEVVIQTLACYKIRGIRIKDYPGVWVNVDGKKKKICSIGLAIKQWVVYHGLALNVNTNLSYFEMINPCGLEPSVMTSMHILLGKKLDFKDVKRKFVESFEKVFNTNAFITKLDVLGAD
jgi:lipoate-protein ligase B